MMYETPSDLLAAADPTQPPVLTINPAAMAPYPVGLSLDIALESAPLLNILDSYGLTQDDYKVITQNPAFQRELADHRESLKIEGWSFRKKAQAQAEVYLDLIFGMVNSPQTPANIKADLIKSTVKWAGNDNPMPVITPQAQQQNLEQLSQQLKDMSDEELELKVLQLVTKQTVTTNTLPDGTRQTTTTVTSGAQIASTHTQKPQPRTVRTPFGEAVIEHNANTYDNDL
jgi:hypothetical protein